MTNDKSLDEMTDKDLGLLMDDISETLERARKIIENVENRIDETTRHVREVNEQAERYRTDRLEIFMAELESRNIETPQFIRYLMIAHYKDFRATANRDYKLN
ncbi:MAG: hypothetical protein AABX19_02070 [Nanoarchaeota archaeon]